MVSGLGARVVFCVAILVALPLEAATVGGRVSDSTGAALPGARVVLRGVATGQETGVETDGEGRFSVEAPATGTYLVIVTRAGFSEAARNARRARFRFTWRASPANRHARPIRSPPATPCRMSPTSRRSATARLACGPGFAASI